MANNDTVDLEIFPGVMTEETDRGAKGRYINCDKIRFRQLLPEKLGGWVLASLGSTDGDINHSSSDFRGLSATYAAAATSIPLSAAVDCSDGDPVWLFGSSITGNYGTVTISDATALAGVFVFDLSIAQTAAIGDAIVIRYPDEFTGGAAVTSGGTEGSQILVLGTNVTTYLAAGTIVRIDLDGGGVQFTETATTIMSGAATITLKDPLTANVAAGTPVRLYARESDIIDSANNFSYVVRFLAAAMAASTTVRLTEALPVDSDAADVNMFPFEQVSCDGDQTGVTSLTVTPATTIANADGLAFPNSIVVLPAFQQDQTAFLGFARALHDWTALDGERWLAIGTDVKLYLVNNGALFDITPIRDSGTLVSPFDTVISSRDVTVNDVNHGGKVGNFVRFSGATTVGGLDMNGEFQITDVAGPDEYTVQALFPATATVVGGGGGAVAFEYDIDVGESGNVTVQGWGTGPYGAGFYGFGSTVAGIQTALRTWSLDNFGEDLLASPNGGSLYHWDVTTGTAVRAALVSTAPATIERMLISPEARHVIAFGAGTGSAAAPGDPDRLLIRWASSEDFTLWIPAVDNSAGDLRLDVGSRIITAVESRGDIIVNTDESLHALQFISGDFVFSLRHLGQSVAIVGPNASVDVNGVVRFMGEDDFLEYDGVLRVMDCPIRNQVFDDFNNAQGEKAFASVNKLFTEIWWFYPDSTSETNTKYAKYNYRDHVWDFGTLPRTAFHDSSAFFRKPYGTFDGHLFTHETGVDGADTDGTLLPITSFIETFEMEIDPGWVMHVSEMIPDFKTLVGSVDVFLFGKRYPQAAPSTEKGPFTILPATEKFEPRYRSRQVGFRVQSDALGDDWRMGTWQAEVRRHGRRGG